MTGVSWSCGLHCDCRSHRRAKGALSRDGALFACRLTLAPLAFPLDSAPPWVYHGYAGFEDLGRSEMHRGRGVERHRAFCCQDARSARSETRSRASHAPFGRRCAALAPAAAAGCARARTALPPLAWWRAARLNGAVCLRPAPNRRLGAIAPPFPLPPSGGAARATPIAAARRGFLARHSRSQRPSPSARYAYKTRILYNSEYATPPSPVLK